ncbi:MAG: hypothetical protein AAGD10_02600 [Myxococcota bacterium]
MRRDVEAVQGCIGLPGRRDRYWLHHLGPGPIKFVVQIWSLCLALSLSSCGGEASTPELCDEACRQWDNCEGQENWYSYEICRPDCESEGDWDEGYVDCLRNQRTCFEMEAQCG